MVGSDFEEHFEQGTESNLFVVVFVVVVAVVVEARHADVGLLVLEPHHSGSDCQLDFRVDC
jgi:hypothetical protein